MKGDLIMQTGITITTRQIKIVAMVAVLAIAVYAIGGDIYPTAPPAPTMKTLDQIYDAVNAASCGVGEREPYSKYFWLRSPNLHPGSDTAEIDVPPGKRLVILMLHMFGGSNHWRLDIDDTIWFYGAIVMARSSEETYLLEFPDRCMAVDGGHTLKIRNTHTSADINCFVVGYFYDVP